MFVKCVCYMLNQSNYVQKNAEFVLVSLNTLHTEMD
jgi:hypothetical protein